LIITSATSRLWRRQRWLGLVAAGTLFPFAAFVSAIAAAGQLLVVQTAIIRGDVIVVLGGNGPPRARRAAALFRANFAPRVLISGAGDCASIRALMIGAGVPNQAIVV
jgi:hypothetical protein